MALSSVTRYPAGVTNVNDASGLADLRFPSSFAYSTMEDDFHTYTAGNWTIAGAAQGVPALVTGAQGDGGVLGVPTTGATGETSVSMSVPAPTFVLSRTKDFFVAARVRLSVADAGLFFGLSGGSAVTPVLTLPADGIFIRKEWTLPPTAMLRIGGTTIGTPVSLPPMVSDQWHDVVIAYTAADGALRAFLDGGGGRIATNPAAFPTAALGLAFSVRTQAASIRNLLIDNYLVAKAR